MDAPVPQRRRGPWAWLTRSRGIQLAAVAVGVVAALLVLQGLVAKPYEIPSESMAPTLEPGEGVLANRLAYRLGEPSVGDVALFHPPVGAVGDDPVCGDTRTRNRARSEPCPRPTPERDETAFIKRIVAGPGDRVRIEAGRPVVNGDPVEEPFETVPCRPPSLCDLPREIVVPDGHYFVLGDHRGGSIDSRHWGPVPREWMIGKAVLSYWPPDRIGWL